MADELVYPGPRGEQDGHHDGEARGQGRVVERHRTQQERDDQGDLGGETGVILTAPPVTGERCEPDEAHPTASTSRSSNSAHRPPRSETSANVRTPSARRPGPSPFVRSRSISIMRPMPSDTARPQCPPRAASWTAALTPARPGVCPDRAGGGASSMRPAWDDHRRSPVGPGSRDRLPDGRRRE